MINDTFFDGFETHDDYVKYGDAFVRVDVPTRTPISHQLTASCALSPSIGSSDPQDPTCTHLRRRLGLRRSW